MILPAPAPTPLLTIPHCEEGEGRGGEGVAMVAKLGHVLMVVTKSCSVLVATV